MELYFVVVSLLLIVLWVVKVYVDIWSLRICQEKGHNWEQTDTDGYYCPRCGREFQMS